MASAGRSAFLRVRASYRLQRQRKNEGHQGGLVAFGRREGDVEETERSVQRLDTYPAISRPSMPPAPVNAFSLGRESSSPGRRP